MQAQDLAKIVEDMIVMARIIDKQLKQQSGQVWFSGDFLGQSGGTSQTMYLQGYGALFLRKVDFLLTPPPKVQEQEKETPKEDVDPVWEQTRRDLYEPQGDRRRGVERPEEKYDAEKVENLKTNIIKSLKHASNIRSLKPEESVILAVTGGGVSSNVVVTPFDATDATKRVIVKDKGNKSTGMSISASSWPSLSSGSGFSSPVVLIMRAKKADIDAFAADKLNLETFRQRVQIFTTETGGDGQDGEMIVQY
jgi:hypothetical protein